MNSTVHLNDEFYYHVNNNMRITTKRERLQGFLDKDILNGILTRDGIFWIEPTSGSSTIPNYVHDEIIKWGTKIKGLKYLDSL